MIRTALLACIGLLVMASSSAFADDDLTTDKRIRVQIDRSQGDVRFLSTFLVAASPDACLSAALDFQAIDKESMVLTSIEPSVELGAEPPETFDVFYRMSFPGKTVEYSLSHRLSKAFDKLEWNLDPKVPSKFDALEGELAVSPHDQGCKVVYSTRVQLGWKIPQFIEHKLSQMSLMGYLRGIRKRGVALGQNYQRSDEPTPAVTAP